MNPREGTRPGLRDYVRVLLRRKWIVVLTVAVAVGSSLLLSYSQTPRYQSTAKLILQTRPTQQIFTSDNSTPDASTLVETEIEVISTEPVQQLVRKKIGSVPPVKVAQVGFTNLITIRATSTSPRAAADIANAYANSYIEFRRKQALDDLAAGSGELQNRIEDIQRQLNDLDSQLNNAPVCVDPKTTAAACTQQAAIQQSVNAQKSALVNQQALFRQRLDQAQVDTALASGDAQVITPATPSGVPFSPTPKRSAVVTGGLGLLLGIAIAFLVEHFDDSIKSKEDFERAAPSLNVLAMIPAVTGWKAKDDPRVVSITEPSAPAAEAYRTLRTAIQFLGVDRPIRAVQVTSPNAHEGKTTTLSNLGVALARAGARVVIVCSDLRRPRIHDFFGLDNNVGFTSVLLGEVPLASALQRVPGVDRLYLLASGPLPPNPSELLQSRRASEVLRQLQSEGNFLLIDSPPILPVTDGLVLSKRVEATLLVASAGRTTRKEIGRTIELLRQVDAPLIGAVLNGVTPESAYGYTYEYYRSDEYAATNAGNGARNGNGSSNGSGNGVKRRRTKASSRSSK